MGGNFKFQVQDSFLEHFFFGDLKNESEKKPPLVQRAVRTKPWAHLDFDQR